MVKEQWASTLDDAWIVDYQIMHQWPVEANSHARLTIGDQVRTLAQKEKTDEEDVIMFYNAYSPPTSFDVDEDGNAVQKNIQQSTAIKPLYLLANKLGFDFAVVNTKYSAVRQTNLSMDITARQTTLKS